MNYEQYSPDDIDEIKVFAQAVLAKISDQRLQRLISQFLQQSIESSRLIDQLAILEPSLTVDVSLGTATLINIYSYVKRNEVAIKALMEIKEEGEPFIHDFPRD